jgi:uncharacterized membrane protein YcgQ (UPF0703/DUF1980 family)
MRSRKRYIVLILFALAVSAIPWKTIAETTLHQSRLDSGSITDSAANQIRKADDKESGSVDADVKGPVPSDTTQTDTAESKTADTDLSGSDLQDTASTPYQPQQTVTIVKDNYPYDIAADRKSFDSNHVDLSVGDRHYMTQINDWFVNFDDYRNKTVEIQGFYLLLNEKYCFVGRNGPTCPYCTGGYVDFEFQSDQDLSTLIPGQSWIRVTGILREGSSALSDGTSQPFYYIEAIRVESLSEEGVNPVSD